MENTRTKRREMGKKGERERMERHLPLKPKAHDRSRVVEEKRFL